MNLKALARAILERNQQGNTQETTRQYYGNFGVQKEAKKFPPVKLTYVACIDCANLDGGYCKAWKHHPDAVEYECRLCKRFVQAKI